MGARERDQCSRETRVGSLSRALPRAFSNERMVRAGTRGIMYDGCCLPLSARNRRASTTSMLTERGTWPGESGGQARTSLGHVTESNTRLALLICSYATRPTFIEKRRDARRAWIAPASPYA
jgi:hypothetical protein